VSQEKIPVREQAICYLVNRLRLSFKAYRGAATRGEQLGAEADFERASAQLEMIGIKVEHDLRRYGDHGQGL
jgi:hypothetical protein